MFQLSKEAIKEFQSLYFQEYKIYLSDSEAMEYGLRLVRFVKAVYGSDLPIMVIDSKNKRINN